MGGHENPNDNITIAKPNDMHLKDYLERHEEFRSLVHIRLHKKWLKIDWSGSLKMNWNFLEVDKNEKPNEVHFSSWFHLEVVLWEAVQKTSIFISCQIRLQIMFWRTGNLGERWNCHCSPKEDCIYFTGKKPTWTDHLQGLIQHWS